MGIEISLEGMNEPHDYELRGGPFDGSSVRLAVEILESPPMRMAFEWMPDSSRGSSRELYILENDMEAYRYDGKKSDRGATP